MMKKGAFAVIPPLKIGPILDISNNGLSFSYRENSRSIGESSELDIFVFGDAFSIPRIPVIKIEAVAMAGQENDSAGCRKRLGIEFGPLTLNQVNKLKNLMENFCLEPALS
jgi:hypothetical protein